VTTERVLTVKLAAIVLGTLALVSAAGCRRSEGDASHSGPTLQDIVFPAKDLPKGFTIPKWEGEDKLPFVSSNPQISRERRFIEGFALELFGQKLATAVERALFVLYADESRDQQILVVAFQFPSAALANDAELAYAKAVKEGAVDPSEQARRDEVLAVMIRGMDVTDAVWLHMQKLLARAVPTAVTPGTVPDSGYSGDSYLHKSRSPS